MITYRFLTGADFPALHRAHLAAFSDYLINVRLSDVQLERMLITNGVRLDTSTGAFDGTELIGFTLNGLDAWQGRSTAYDAGTGIVPAHRGRGVGTELFDFMLPQLAARGVEQYLLEVISSNEPAVKLYRKLGFRETRRLLVLKREAPSDSSLGPKRSAAMVRESTSPDWLLFESFWDAPPSWQNSVASIKRSRAQKIILEAQLEENCVGYCVVSTTSGNIAQLAVSRRYRRQGIGTLLLQALQPKVEVGKPLQVQNLDGSLTGALAFYEARGFHWVLDQHEMVKDL